MLVIGTLAFYMRAKVRRKWGALIPAQRGVKQLYEIAMVVGFTYSPCPEHGPWILIKTLLSYLRGGRSW
jgi:hypothetical protein